VQRIGGNIIENTIQLKFNNMKVITIGHHAENNVVINDPLVSRHHCQIIKDDDGNCRLSDLDSANGTFVNGNQIKGEVPLNQTDVVRIGNTTLLWQSYLEEKYTPVTPAGTSNSIAGNTIEKHGRKSDKKCKKWQLYAIGSSIVVVAAAVCICLLFSCNRGKNAKYIPKDAVAVASIDFRELPRNKEAKNIKSLLEDKDIKEFMRQLEEESSHAAKLVEDMFENPNALGIKLTERIYGFISMASVDDATFGIICSIDAKKMEENFMNLKKDITDLSDYDLKEKNGIKYCEIEDEAVFGWKDNVGMIIVNSKRKNLFDLLEKHLSLNKQESIKGNPDFKDFEKNGQFFNLFVSSNFIKAIDERDIQSILNKAEDYTGIDVNNNYFYFYWGFQNDRMSVTATIKYNETIQNMDIDKILRNKEKIIQLLDDYMYPQRRYSEYESQSDYGY
jgi:hypothetical protein